MLVLNVEDTDVIFTRPYQPKATTLTCILVRMVALVLIIDYPFPNRFPFVTNNHKYKATNIYEYFTPYACLISPSLHNHPKYKVTNI